MLRFERIADLRRELRARTLKGQRVGFVPTMGALHEGHLSLMRRCATVSDVVVVSIFVNPLQFGPKEDFSKYPRDTEGDVAKAAAAGAEICFVPSVEEMYPDPVTIHVQAGDIASRWEGALRPGHFDGVLTVVAKLFNIVEPDISLFGQKDFQQAVLVQSMLRDLSFRTEMMIVPTVRDHDGLALSSRNAYLSDEMRSRAVCIPRSLATLFQLWRSGEQRSTALRASALEVLARNNIAPDYLTIVDPHTLREKEIADTGTVALIAARVGNTRLIDNIILSGTLDAALLASLNAAV